MQEKILRILINAGKNGILQEEFTKKYGISKSTVSTILSKFEDEGKIVRRRVAGKSYRVWHVKYSPFPIPDVLRVGIGRATEYPAVLLAYKDSDYPKIELKIYKNAFTLTKDLAEGYLDVGCSPLITQALFALVYRNIKIRAGCGFRGGGIALRVSNPKIFGSSELSTMEFSLRTYIEKTGIDAQIRYFPSPDRMIKALGSGEVDAIAIWEPFVTELSQRYKIIRFEELFGRYPCCTLATNLQTENSKEVREFLKIYKNAVEQLEERKDEAISLEAKFLRIKKARIEKAFYGFDYDWKLDMNVASKFLEEFGLKLTNASKARIFNLL